MNHLISINEFFINKNNIYFLINKLIQNISENFDDVHVVENEKYHKNNVVYYHLQINPIKPKEISKIEKLLKIFIQIFEKNELYFYFTSKRYNNNGLFTYVYDCYVKNDKIQRVKPPKFVYHATDKNNRESIYEYGLSPKSNYRWSNHLWYRPSIFASSNIDNMFKSGKQYDIWIIDTEKIQNKWYLDLNINKYIGYEHNDYIMTFEHIPPQALDLLE